jgi:hypothetical protein
MSNFLIIGLVCAQIVLAEKLANPRKLLRSPSNTEYGTKAFGALQEIGRAGILRLRLVPPFVPLRDGSQTHYHYYYLPFVSYYLHFMIYPLVERTLMES